MRIITSPENADLTAVEKPIVFLAGGISGCPNWQQNVIDFVQMYGELHGTLLNPRRENFVMTPANEYQQIGWEFRGIVGCDLQLFWFPKDTDCPITLLELGKAIVHPEHHVIIGIEPGYRRANDVRIQTELALEEWGLPNLEYHLVHDYDGQKAPQKFYDNLPDLFSALKRNIEDYYKGWDEPALGGGCPTSGG